MEGIFIPKEFYKNIELKGLERDILALYKYYTENGTSKCCCLNNSQIAEIFCVSERYLRMVKRHLRELGYIRTDGGIKVYYIGFEVGSTVPQVGSTVPIDGKHSSYQIGSTVPIKQEAQFLHKKEKKEKKEIKKEEKRIMTNFEMLLDKLTSDYKTPEKIDYIKDKYEERINNTDLIDGVMDSWITNIKIELNQQFPMNYVIEKKKPISNTIDVL